jgi:pimeloyl-ACP methyl ester carboxylesterase
MSRPPVDAIEYSPAENANAQLRCILVHGTYTTSATWDRHGSSLIEKLGTLDSRGVLLGRFSWSGENTNVARVAAARCLSKLLAGQAIEHPDTRFLLIGHSHGGTVALSAIAGVPTAQRAGVVCLSTPFFHVRLRSVAALVWIRAGLAAILAALGWFLLSKVAAFVSVLQSSLRPDWLTRLHSWLWKAKLVLLMGRFEGFFATCLFVLYTAALCLCVAQPWADHPPQAQLRIRARWEGVRPQSVRTLCLWYGPDEAFWLLRWIREASEWLHSLVSAAVRYLMPAGASVAAFAILGLGALRSEIWRDATGWTRWSGVSTLAQIVLFLGCMIVTVPLLLWMLAALISITSMFAVGSRSPWDHFWLDIHTQRTPQIEATFIRHRELTLPDGKLLANLVVITFPFTSQSLIHSRVYDDPETAKEIAAWYKTVVSDSLT